MKQQEAFARLSEGFCPDHNHKLKAHSGTGIRGYCQEGDMYYRLFNNELVRVTAEYVDLRGWPQELI